MQETPFDLPATDPTDIYRARDGVVAVDLIVAAICHLDLFTLLGREAMGVEALRGRLGLARRPADVLLTLLAAMGLIERDGTVDGDGERVRATLRAREFLAADSPWSLAPYYHSLRERPLVQSMLEVLRSGAPARWTAEDDEWARKMEDGAFARAFTAEMDCRGVYLGPLMARQLDLDGRARLLDVGGGSGVYACAVAAAHPHVRATVLEKPPVDAIARREIERRGFSARVDVVEGDMFATPLPAGADVHLWSNVLHDWGEEKVRRLLGASFEALPAGGLIAIHDAFLNREKTGPLHVAEYSALLMHFTEGKCYSIGEMEAMLAEAGFVEPEHREVAAARGLVTARKPIA